MKKLFLASLILALLLLPGLAMGEGADELKAGGDPEPDHGRLSKGRRNYSHIGIVRGYSPLRVHSNRSTVNRAVLSQR